MKIERAVGLTVLLAATANGGQKIMQPGELIAQEKRYQAELRAEANAPGPAPADARRMAIVLGKRRIAEDHQIAEYEKFKMAQQIALAQAQAPSIVVNNYTSSMEGRMATAQNQSTHANRYMKAAFVQEPESENAREMPLQTRRTRGQPLSEKKYPDRFYRTQVLDNSIDRMISRVDAISAQVDDHTFLNGESPASRQPESPFAVPVRGQPGYVMSPYSRSSELIDVRGYESGTEVREPTTGRLIRVP